MQRVLANLRPDWQERVQALGLTFHLTDARPYWDESVYYRFDSKEIEALEAATLELNRLCLQAVEHVVTQGLWARFHIPAEHEKWIAQSWERDEITIYGRFDLAYDGDQIKLLEYNADTPTGLIEAAVVQWHWMNEVFGQDAPDASTRVDQWNSLHESLIEAWRRLPRGERIVFVSMDDGGEDFMTVNYLRDTAMQAGHETAYLPMEEIGWDNARRVFVDAKNRPMRRIFKLYPWEWMLREKFGALLRHDSAQWLEAPWKAILSNKALLPLLWEMFPDHPQLLRAEIQPFGESYVRKPMFGREGANTQIIIDGEEAQSNSGAYKWALDAPDVYQEYFAIPQQAGCTVVLGSWIVNGNAAGLGIREEGGLITTNQSRFVPHIIQS